MSGIFLITYRIYRVKQRSIWWSCLFRSALKRKTLKSILSWLQARALRRSGTKWGPRHLVYWLKLCGVVNKKMWMKLSNPVIVYLCKANTFELRLEPWTNNCKEMQIHLTNNAITLDPSIHATSMSSAVVQLHHAIKHRHLPNNTENSIQFLRDDLHLFTHCAILEYFWLFDQVEPRVNFARQF